MAKIADTIYKQEQQRVQAAGRLPARPVIVRFCGTTPGSSTGLALVRSICRQVHQILGHPLSLSDSLLTASYADVVKHFHALLYENPLVLVLDSLDQLSNDDLARSDLSFLRGVRPHPNTRIIVSALPDERDADTGKWVYCYGCETKLKEANIPRVFVPKIELAAATTVSAFSGLTATRKSEVQVIFESLLACKGRRLTVGQWDVVSQQVAHEPTALYLRLASRVVESWTSSQPASSAVLAAGVRPLIVQIFETLEVAYGRCLTQAAFGFLSFSVDGLTDTEMEVRWRVDVVAATTLLLYAVLMLIGNYFYAM